MIQFTTIIKKFSEQGEKTGWTYIEVPAALALQLKEGNKKAFRVKGKLDAFAFEKISLVPIGGGNFILPLNAQVRKKIKKEFGTSLHVQLEVDDNALVPPAAFIECLKDEPSAFAYFNRLPMSHQNYFIRWLTGVKGETAVAKRMAIAVTALLKKQDFGEMIRGMKKNENFG
jgi:hypothetical protein